MNRFQLEQFLSNHNTEDDLRDTIERDETIVDFVRSLYGGAAKDSTKVEAEVVDTIQNPSTKMEIYRPIVTRPIMSKFEYVGAITSLALYLKGLKSIAKYADIVDCSALVNPSELAFHLLDQGKMNVILIRNRSEKVSFSELYVNQLWRQEILDYFKTKNQSMEQEFYKPLSEVIKAE